MLSLRSIGNPTSEHDMAGMAHASGALTPAMLGSVSFQTSCRPQFKEKFNRVVALLHSFWLDEAERTFKAVAISDPDCAMAQWGVAMTNFNQVNGGPTPAGVVAAKQALAKADVAREKDGREAVYIGALHNFFDGYVEKDFQTYAEQNAGAMAKVAAAYPNDLEAQVFYALALINSEPRDDVALANKKNGSYIPYFVSIRITRASLTTSSMLATIREWRRRGLKRLCATPLSRQRPPMRYTCRLISLCGWAFGRTTSVQTSRPKRRPKIPRCTLARRHAYTRWNSLSMRICKAAIICGLQQSFPRREL
jgi:hypothetical protein